MGGGPAQEWIRQRWAIDLGHGVTGCIQQMIKDDEGAIGGRAGLPVEVEGDGFAEPEVFPDQIIADQLNRPELAGRWVLPGVKAQDHHGWAAVGFRGREGFQQGGFVEVAGGVFAEQGLVLMVRHDGVKHALIAPVVDGGRGEGRRAGVLAQVFELRDAGVATPLAVEGFVIVLVGHDAPGSQGRVHIAREVVPLVGEGGVVGVCDRSK